MENKDIRKIDIDGKIGELDEKGNVGLRNET